MILPAGVTVAVDGDRVTVKGPLGELSRAFSSDVTVSVVDNGVIVTPRKDAKEFYAIWGTVAAHIANMIAGVQKPYEKKLILEGVGFRVEMKGEELVMQLGFSHPVSVQIPKGLTVSVEKNNIAISGIDKELVGQFAAELRAQKPPEPYKGKGMRYADEVIRRKEGKRAA